MRGLGTRILVGKRGADFGGAAGCFWRRGASFWSGDATEAVCLWLVRLAIRRRGWDGVLELGHGH